MTTEERTVNAEPHFANTGATVEQTGQNVTQPDLGRLGSTHRHLKAGATSAFLMLPLEPGSFKCPFHRGLRVPVHASGALSLPGRLPAGRRSLVVFIEFVYQHKSVSTCLRTVFRWQMCYLGKHVSLPVQDLSTPPARQIQA